MTDQDLLKLLEDKRPADLSAEELEYLRARLPASAELQQLVFSDVHLEEAIVASLSRPAMSPKAIVARAKAASSKQSFAARLGWMLGLGLVAFGLWWWNEERLKEPEPVRIVATSQKDKVKVDPAPTDGDTLVAEPIVAEPSVEKPAELAPIVDIAQNPVPPPEPEKMPVVAPEKPEPKPAEPPVVAQAPSAPDKKSETPPGKRPAQTAAPMVSPIPDAPLVAAKDPDLQNWPELDPRPAAVKPVAEGLLTVDELPPTSQNELRRWLEPVPGQPHQFFEAQRSGVPVAGFQGLVHLKAPWVDKAVLRFAPFEDDQLTIHLWHEQQGVTLQYLRPLTTWVAYQTTRRGTEPRPITLSLAGTDDWRFERTSQGPVELRYQDGTVVLSRGKLRLITVALPGPPTDVYFDKRAWMRSFAMSLGQPLVDDLPELKESLLEEQPSSLKWSPVVAKGAQFNSHEDGSVSLTSEPGTETVWTTVKLPKASLFEYTFLIEGPGIGTGLVFCDEENRPLTTVSYSRESRTGWTTFGFLPKETVQFASTFDPNYVVMPVSRQQQWLRLIAGPGSLKCWTSSDGRHWTRALDPLRPFRGPIASVGLICFKTTEAHNISLRQLQARELTSLTELSSQDIVETVPVEVYSQVSNPTSWLTHVIDSQPSDVSADDWRTACALRTLANVPLAPFGNHLLSILLDERLSQPGPAEKQLKLIDQAALLWDAWEPAECIRVAKLYERVGQRLAREGHRQPYTAISLSLLGAPIWSPSRYQVMPESLVKTELYGRVLEEDWDSADELCDQLKFWNRPSSPDILWHDQRQGVKLLVDWVTGAPPAAIVKGRGRKQRGRPGKDVVIQPSAFKHPLVIELSKEGYNTLAEVQVALSEGAFKDACQIISTVKMELALGVLPDAREGQLLVSLPQAVANSMRDYPALRETMNTVFGPTARLRVQHAIAEGNPLALQGATVQFYGTQASSDAHIWLGDRALTAGEFVTALGNYEQARRGLGTDPPGLSARLRLAAALLGRDAEHAVTESVVLNDVRWSPADFEKLVTEVRQQAGGEAGQPKLIELEAVTPAKSPARVQYVAQPARLKWPGDLGRNPASWPAGEVDWIARQFSGQVHGDVLIASNRFSVSAIDLTTNVAKWTHTLAEEQGEAHGWHLTPMRPVVAGNRVFVRRLNKDGPDIAALDFATGALVWKVRPLDFAASDPVLVQELLYAFSVSTAHDGTMQMSLSAINPHTGDVLWQRPVLRLIDAWGRQTPCHLTAAGDRLVASIGGTVVCCDLDGLPLWVRRQAWVPLTHEPIIWDQQRTPPLIVKDKVLVVQPGVMSVECLDLSGGRRVWVRPFPDVRRLLGAAGGRVYVESGRAAAGVTPKVTCLALETGTTQWDWSDDALLDANLVAEDGSLLCTSLEVVKPNEIARPRLVWLDPQTGQELAIATVETLTDKSPRLGPLFSYKDKLVGLYGKFDRDVDRELVQLAPSTIPALAGASDLSWKRWAQTSLSPRVVNGIDAVLPGWTCLASAEDPAVGLLLESRGQTNVAATLATHELPVSLVRDVAVPMGKRTRLIALVGCLDGEKWALDVRIAGRTLETLAVSDMTTGNGWKELQVDLSEYAGQSFTILVEQQHSGKPAHGQWKRLDIISD